MNRYNLLALILLSSIWSYAQNTHTVGVAINQPPACEEALGLDLSEHVKVWPNPARSTITLDLPFPTAEIQIIDASGKVVISNSWKQSNAEIDVSLLPSGLYHIKVNHETGSKSLNIILK